jgi:transposase InsO family protein
MARKRWWKKKRVKKSVVRAAEEPGQTINIDLLFVPEQHKAEERLPAVSGSSGHLIVGRTTDEKEKPEWPGLAFMNNELTYEEAMRQYISETRDRLEHRKGVKETKKGTDSAWHEKFQARSDRYQVRKLREQQDRDWEVAKTEWHDKFLAFQALSRKDRKRQRSEHEQYEASWKAYREQRQKISQQRKWEDQEWHQRHQQGKENALPERTWIAILVIIDNCSRQCLGLPIFRSGAHVTSEEVVAALQMLLPDDLAFLISDQGAHFRSMGFALLAKNADFVHVPVYRHRPESNGIAERFVLTFKDWLRDKSWQDVTGVQSLSRIFEPEYNDRPHQGLPIPGLSPNEFARRVWIF